ncbi:MAG: NCS2 family permease [Deltaproteobacteria bacterium]|nr:MAG: NCS2 family permease [Deltaproteobacteria bacterium]
MLERWFELSAHGTTVRAEVRGGVVTFLTMSYIIFVQPGVLASAGMDFGAVLVATCLSSALATVIMALGANYPVALAPCMGENFFFVTVVSGVVTGQKVGWQAALAAVFLSGVLFLLLAAFRFREKIIDALPRSLKFAIPAGIGLFIAFIGLQQGGLVVAAPGSMVKLGDLGSPVALLSLFGLVVTAALMARRVTGAILLGILATTALGLASGVLRWQGLFDLPPDPRPVLLQLDLAALWDTAMIPVVVIFLFMVLFDTIGTLVGVGQQAGLLRDGKLERAGRALLADAVGTTAGALLGTSTVSSYIESAAGVAAGARTGLAALVTAAGFLLALFCYPLVKTVGGGVEVGAGVFLHPVTAPVMVLVGFLMLGSIRQVPWDDPAEAIPAFLVLVGMPLTYSIADGLALGFVAYPLLMLLAGRGRGVPALVYVMALLLGGVFVVKALLGG